MNRISIITLGVKDMTESVKFYRDGLGFVTHEKTDNSKIVFFNTPGTKFELCPLELLPEDMTEANPPKIANGFAGIAFGYYVRSKKEVDGTLKLARKAGAVITKKPRKASWGGYHGYFRDLNGYYWEVAYNPAWSLDKDDMLVW